MEYAYSTKKYTLNFFEAIKNKHPRSSILERGFYVQQLKRIWNYFPKEQTLILKNESLRENPLNTLNSIYEFLGVKLLNEVKPINVNSRKYVIKMSDEEKDYLIGVYKEEIKNLEKLLGWDCYDWLQV